MKRLVDQHLQRWKEDIHRKPLLLRGARQVGKTYAVREFGKTYQQFIEINFERQPEIRTVFDRDLQPERILRDLALFLGRSIDPTNSLLFFDEIQTTPKALLALRYFYEEMPTLHLIAAGSLIDFTTEEVGIPVGRVTSLYMYPLSFIEFLHAMHEDLLAQEIMRSDISKPFAELVHQKLLRLLGEYLAIGGMPEAVYKWQQTNDIFTCFETHNSLIDTYRQDFNTYAKKFQMKYVKLLFDHIPLSLGQKFKFSAVPGEYRKRELSPCLDLLTTAGIVHKVFQTDAHGIPLGAQANPDDFKTIFLDVALSQAILGLNGGDWLTNPLEQFVNKGSLVEAFVGQEMLAYANPFKKTYLYYWHREAKSSQAEIDYVLQTNETVVPIEVKSGEGSTLKSMHIFLESHQKSPVGIRFSTQNFSLFQNIHSYPLYAVVKLGDLKK
jgi:hypothetical protein